MCNQTIFNQINFCLQGGGNTKGEIGLDYSFVVLRKVEYDYCCLKPVTLVDHLTQRYNDFYGLRL